MLDQNSRLISWVSVQSQLYLLSRQKKQCRDIVAFVFVLAMSWLVATISAMSSISCPLIVCCNKVHTCRDISTTFVP